MSEETIEKSPDALLWMDIETTGLDPERDRILEVEMRVTDMRGEEGDDGVHVLIPVGERLDISRAAMQMHTANGLLDEALWAERSQDGPAEVLREYVNTMSSYYVLHPAGSSVHFDMEFLTRLAPGLFDRCDHRRLDVSSQRMAMDAAGVDLPEQEPTDHRTSTCLERDIAQYRTMLETLAGLRAPSGVDGVVRGE